MSRTLFVLLSLASLAPSFSAQQLLNTLWPPRGRMLENYGTALDLDGSRLVVGSFRQNSPGVLFVYRREGANWIEEARLTNRTEAEYVTYDYFGATAEVSGKRVAASAPEFSGSVYVFDEQPDRKWSRTVIPPPDAASGEDVFGIDLQLQGDTLVASTQPFSSPNSVYVFDLVGGAWTQTARFQDLRVTDMRLDGDTLVLASNLATPSVRIYSRLGLGWLLTKTIPVPQASHVALANGVLAVSNVITTFYEHVGTDWLPRGTVSAVGGQVELAGSHLFLADVIHGNVSVFERDAAGIWALVNTLLPDALEPDDKGSAGPGFARDIAADGSTLIVSAPQWSGSTLHSGALLTYSFDSHATLTATPQHLSLVTGGTQELLLDAGLANAGRPFLLGGSLSGTSPGFFVGSHHIPLQPDSLYYPLSLRPGVLDGLGRAHLSVQLPPLTPDFSHDTLHHGFVVFDPGHGIVHISNIALGALNYRQIP